jgi:predicted aspartyl protease
MSHNKSNKSPEKQTILPIPFKAFTIKYLGCVDRIITPIELTAAFNPEETPIDPSTFFQTNALWDTGATKSVVTKTTAEKVGLTPVGNVRINHAGGSGTTSTYLINVLLPNRVHLSGVLVSECPDNTGDFGAIIGMDVIASGDFAITNCDNKTCMTFRIPPYRKIDFVIESNKMIYPGAKPFAPCPCGARDRNGKPISYSKCHGRDS